MILLGHDAPPTYALAWSDCTKPVIASGGRDGSVIVWNIESHVSLLEGFKAPLVEENGRGSNGFPSIDENSGYLPPKSRHCKIASQAAIHGMSRRAGKESTGPGASASTPGNGAKNGKSTLGPEVDTINEFGGDDSQPTNKKQ